MKIPHDEHERVLKLELAFALYKRGILAMGPARRLAGVPKREFLEELRRREIKRHYAASELDEDLTYARGSSHLVQEK